MEDKYKNDKYDRSLYIPKGYILPNGIMLTKQYARFHEDMAERYISEYCYEKYVNDVVSDKKDFMLMRLGALQVMSCGMPVLLFCEGNQNKIIQDAIESYVSFGWKIRTIPNPYSSYSAYLRYLILKDTELVMEEYTYEKENVKQYIFKRR